MIFGDPSRFAIWIDKVQEWGSGAFVGGLFHFIVDGSIFPDSVKSSTLFTDILSLLDVSSPLVTFQEDQVLFEMRADEAFRRAVATTYPEALDTELTTNSHRFKASTENIDDFGFTVFAISHEERVRLIGAKRSELCRYEGRAQWVEIQNYQVKEAVLSKSEVRKIIADVSRYRADLESTP